MEGPFLPTTTRTAAAGTTAKRHLEEATATAGGMANGSSKRRPKPPPPPIVVPPGHSAFRLLCHVSIIGGVIGKSGSIISVFRQETGSKIRVEEAVPSCDERVILVVGPDGPSKKKILLLSSSSSPQGEQEEEEVSAAQEALLRVFERVLEVEEEEGAAGSGKPVSCRLLAATSQVGSLMGKGGKKIEKIRKESGAKIRVLPMEQLPACAAPDDELIQIMGDALAVKKALAAVSHCLKDGPPSDKQLIVSRAQRSVPQRTLPDARMEFLSHRNSLLPPTPGSSTDYASSGHPVPMAGDMQSTLDQKKALQEVSFRLLCSNDKIGGVIGKGGTIVRTLQNETGASISVGASVADSGERVITVSASETPESLFSLAQNAVLRVFRRSVEAGIENGVEPLLDKGATVNARLLVPTNQIGCLMGKGGAIIEEMRRVSCAGIRIIGGGQIPKCASENDEVVQITGELGNVQDALFHVTSRLRDNFFPAKIPNIARTGVYSSSHAEITSYGRVGPTSPRLYPSMGLTQSIDRQATLAHSMDHLGLSNNINCPSSPKLRASQIVGGGNYRAIPDARRGLTTNRGGIELGSGNKSAIVINTSIDILVPESVFGLVYGENGSNLSRIRQISGATVVVHDPLPPGGGGNGRVIISGTPDQTQAAQSLLQAFILSGQPSAADPRY